MIDKAVGFAARAHYGQKRKTGKVPFIAHPVGVAMILQQMDCDETVVAAGLLHDIVEDTNVTADELRYEFGDEVADIVAGCTEPRKKGDNWEYRKKHLITTLVDAPLSVKVVAATDKYHNLSHALDNLKHEQKDVWRNFGRGAGRQAWYYRTVLKSINAGLPDPKPYPIFEQLSLVIEELFDGVTSEAP